MSKESGKITPLKVLILGTGEISGGREGALTSLFDNSEHTENVYIAPGNGGSNRFEKTQALPSLKTSNHAQVIEAVRDLGINFVLPGPEDLLVAGIVDDLEDAFKEENVYVYGPSKEHAMLEGSKAHAVRFMQEHHIPHPKSLIFQDYEFALSHLTEGPLDLFECFGSGVVIKASGLAGGKGVIVCDTREEARDALRRVMKDEEFGEAGREVVIQEKLIGTEISAIAITAGGHYLKLPYTEDHKQAYDGDKGPNTGGMGVSIPHPEVTDEMKFQIEKLIITPTLAGIYKDTDKHLKGTLYAGIMWTDDEPKVLEYNMRFGDPEMQAQSMLFSDENNGGIDFARVLLSAARKRLAWVGKYPVKEGFGNLVTLASGGYPGLYETGYEIIGVDKVEGHDGIVIFHGGTALENGVLETAGGRVLYVGARAKTEDEAYEQALDASDNIIFQGKHFRKDIGRRRRNAQ